MKLHVLDMPEDAPQLAGWLEEHLLGLDLAAVAAELHAVRPGAEPGPASLEDALGEDLPRVLESGLGVLSVDRLRRLLRRPELLLQLQVRIFLDGGRYWSSRPQAADMGERIDRGRERVRMFLVGQRPTTAPVRPDDERHAAAGAARAARRPHPLLVSLVTAAAVLAGVFFARPQAFGPAKQPVASGWGWSKSGAIDDALPANDYLTKLADGANDWFKKRPATSADLAKRIGEFRQGCSTLILSEHKPLKPADKAWLIERCQAWAKKLDAHLADAEAGKDVLKVRDETDATIRTLMEKLRERAGQA